MELKSLTLDNYRNFGSLEWAPPPGLLVLSGDNAQGKSNLLEAVYLLAIARSYRASAERDLVSWDTSSSGGYALVDGIVERQDGPLEIRIGLEYEEGAHLSSGVRKFIKVNGITRRASDLVGLFRVVFFSPPDIDLVFGPPVLRRRYLDLLLCQLDSNYVRSLQRYNRVLAQRNHLLRRLRDHPLPPEELRFWDESLCSEGAFILEARYSVMDRLSELAQSSYKRLGATHPGSNQSISVEYLGTASSNRSLSSGTLLESFEQALQSSRVRERAVFQTVIGPHRDDVKLSLNGRELSRYASRGQARIATLALRLAEGGLLSERRGEPPVLLLDDILSELDAAHRSMVLQEAFQYPQALITTTSTDLLPNWYRDHAHHFQVSNGRVEPYSPE